MLAYQNYWNQGMQGVQQPQQPFMMAPYYYYTKTQNMYYPNYSPVQSSQYMAAMSSNNSMNTMRAMNPMGAMSSNNSMNTMRAMNPMGMMNPMGAMNAMGAMNTMGAMNPMGAMNTMGAMNPMAPMSQISPVTQYYGMYPPPVYNNFQKYENYTVQNSNAMKKLEINNKSNETKQIKNEPVKNEKALTTASKEKKSSEKVKQRWWKVNVNKSREDQDISNRASNETQAISSHDAELYTTSSKKHHITTPGNRMRKKSTASILSSKRGGKPQRNASIISTKSINKRKNNLIVLKKEVSLISEPQKSQDIFHLINNARGALDGYEPTTAGIKQTFGYYDYNDIQNRMSTTKLYQKETKEKVSNHCKEILSKFAIEETSNEYITQAVESTNIDNYKDLGKNMNNTMFFIMNEMHSINAASTNYLSMKLTPRQKQRIALLIVEEVNALNVPQQFWGHVCRLVIHTLNDNFRLYFEKLKEHPELTPSEKNSWLWMVDLANNAQ